MDVWWYLIPRIRTRENLYETSTFFTPGVPCIFPQTNPVDDCWSISQCFCLFCSSYYHLFHGDPNIPILLYYFSGWWFGCHFLFSHSYWGCIHHPNWLIFFRGVALAHQPVFFFFGESMLKPWRSIGTRGGRPFGAVSGRAHKWPGDWASSQLPSGNVTVCQLENGPFFWGDLWTYRFSTAVCLPEGMLQVSFFWREMVIECYRWFCIDGDVLLRVMVINIVILWWSMIINIVL